MSSIFDGLNESQKQAVAAVERSMLVLAGPGTGKTLTMVRRIAALIHQGVRPERILAATFTNRAAREMRERAEALLGDAASRVFIGTFHLLGLRIIRDSRGDDFAVYSRDEQVELLKSLRKVSARKVPQAAERISRIKNFLEDPDAETRDLYEAYQAALAQQHAVDFDDLIRLPLEMLQNTEIARRCQDRFSHIIVDEYQDINPAQHRLLRLLAASEAVVCAVGDVDQAIYAFRGADPEQFLGFEKSFPGTARITLAENYRSTAAILSAAEAVIRNNQKRIDRELLPTREPGPPVAVISVPDERAEGAAVIEAIERRMGGTSHYRIYAGAGHAPDDRSYRFSDFAVLYRTNAQAKALEEAFIESGIPYQIIGRQGDRQRKVIDETVAWLHTLAGSPDAGTDAAGGSIPAEAKLLTPADYFDPRADAVTLMTLHMAKGLEFKVVFIAGCEDGLIPCTLMQEDADAEEERRLFYVGMTRAQEELFLLHARSRFLYGQRLAPRPSPFLAELPEAGKTCTVVPDRPRRHQEEDRQLGLF